MKIRYLFPVTLAAVLAFGSCKKDNGDKKEEEFLSVEYDGKDYKLDEGIIWDYKTGRYNTHNTYAYFVLRDDEDFSPWGDYTLQSDEPPISIFYYLSIPKSSSTIQGEFEFYELEDDWFTGLPEIVQNKRIFTEAVVGFDANGDLRITPPEVIKVTDGTISTDGTYTIYALELENGKTVTGRLKTAFSKELPPA